MPLHYAPPQGVMTFVPTPQPAQQPLPGAPSQSGGPAVGAQHHVMMAQPAAQQHSIHTAVPPQMIIPSQPQPGIQAPPVGGHQYVQAHALQSNLSCCTLLCHVICNYAFGMHINMFCVLLTSKLLDFLKYNIVVLLS